MNEQIGLLRSLILGFFSKNPKRLALVVQVSAVIALIVSILTGMAQFGVITGGIAAFFKAWGVILGVFFGGTATGAQFASTKAELQDQKTKTGILQQSTTSALVEAKNQPSSN